MGAPVASAAGLAGRLSAAARGDCGAEVECQLFEAVWGLINWLLTTL